MKDRLKKALKRAASGLMAVLLAVCLVGTPRAKAVVTEGALLGSLFGSLLVSMGYSWAADNFDAPTFGEAIYGLIQQCDQEKDTGIQLLLDSGLAGLTAVGNGKLTFSQQWVKLANSFAKWFQEKFFSSDYAGVVYETPTNGGIALANGDVVEFSVWDGNSSHEPDSYGYLFTGGENFVFPSGWSFKYEISGSKSYWTLLNADGQIQSSTSGYTQTTQFLVLTDDGVRFANYSSKYGTVLYTTFPDNCISIVTACSLTAEKPQEVHYPEVAEDDSQVYEITVDGVTATDIEGIVQGAVDRILAGTAVIAGEVTQAGTGEIVENPEIDTYKVGLSSVFPFCIPFDVYNMVTMFVAEPEAPSAEWTFTLPWSNQEYSVGWDLSAFDGVARVCRDMELVLFAVGLAVITYKVIKW